MNPPGKTSALERSQFEPRPSVLLQPERHARLPQQPARVAQPFLVPIGKRPCAIVGAVVENHVADAVERPRSAAGWVRTPAAQVRFLASAMTSRNLPPDSGFTPVRSHPTGDTTR